MARHNDTGRLGEELALRYLQELGWDILAVNWRYGRAEIDIIARDKDILVFVEVKTRRSTTFGRPEEAVSSRKMARLAQAAIAYMALIGHEWEVRFDVISILLPNDGPDQLDHIRDAFFPGL